MTDAIAAKQNDLGTRVLSALVLAPVALALAWLGGWPFAALVAAAGVAMAVELAALLPGAAGRERAMLAGVAVAAVGLAASGLPIVALIAGAAGFAFSLAIRLWRGEAIWAAFFAYPYLILPLVALVWLRSDAALGRATIFWLLGSVWAIDTFAYFAGRSIGGPKLWPRLSPKKTWAGLGGGMLGAAIVGGVTTVWVGVGSAVLLALIGALFAVIEQAGDFCESALKRHAGVKDSGRLIPGHGGILDRVDGLVAVTVGAALLSLLHGGASAGAGVLIWP